MSTPSAFAARPLPSFVILIAFLVLVVGGGGLIGVTNQPGAWYATLHKPPFTPPNWLFGPAWGVLYLLIAVAGWRIFMAAPRTRQMALWVAQMVLNWLWSPAAFTLHLLWPAFVVLLLLLACILAFITLSRRHDPVAAWLLVPYALWVAFAGLLNLSLAVLN